MYYWCFSGAQIIMKMNHINSIQFKLSGSVWFSRKINIWFNVYDNYICILHWKLEEEEETTYGLVFFSCKFILIIFLESMNISGKIETLVWVEPLLLLKVLHAMCNPWESQRPLKLMHSLSHHLIIYSKMNISKFNSN